MWITGRYVCVLAAFALMLAACDADPVGDLDEGTADAETDTDSDVADSAEDDDSDATDDDADADEGDDADAADADDGDTDTASADNAITVATDQADELDPTTYATAAASSIMDTFCQALYTYDYDSELHPLLAAEEPEVSDDGLTVTIPLREDAVFNDDTPMDAEAVQTSLERHQEHPESGRSGEIEIVTDIQVVDDYTVELTLEEPFAPLTATLAGPPGRIMSPTQLEEMGDDFADDPICVGPFQFVERPDQDVVVVEKSDLYYDADSVELEEITFQAIEENAVAINNLLAGEIDVTSVAPTNLEEVEGADGLQIVNTPGVGYQGITTNIGNVDGTGEPPGEIDTPMASDPNIREAFELSLDKEAINEIVFDGLHTPACSVVSPEVPFHEAAPECPQQDTEAAQQLIEESEFDAPVEVSLMTTTAPDMTRVAELVQSMAGEAGFEVSVESMEATTSIDMGNEGEFDLWLIGFGSGPDPDAPLFRMNHTTGSSNSSGFGAEPVDEEIDELLEATRSEPDEEARIELLREPLELLAERRNIIYLFHPSHTLAARDDLTGLDLKYSGQPDYAEVGFSG